MPVAIGLVVLLGVLFFGANKVNSDDSEKINNELNKFDALFKKYGAQFGIDWRFLKIIAMNESSLGQNRAVKRGLEKPDDIEGSTSSDKKSWGLMQFTLRTARQYEAVSEVNLNNPETSIRLAAKHFSYLSKMFGREERSMAMAYNHGEGNQRRFLELEQLRILKPTDYPAGRAYWDKFLKNKEYLMKNKLI